MTFTVGFIRLSNQESHMAKCTTRHSQANYQLGLSGFSSKPISNWVYKAAQPSQYTIGFIRLSANPISFGFIKLIRQWKGRMAKLLAHSRSRDTSTRSIWHDIHNTYTPNTRKHPLLCSIVPQAIPSLPVLFRVWKEENQPSRLVCEVPSHNRFIKQL